MRDLLKNDYSGEAPINIGDIPMAQKVTTLLVDDITGETAVDTFRFGWQGKDYEIDLSAVNGKALEESLQEFIPHARVATNVATNGGRKQQRVSPRTDRERINAIRAWAAGNGHELSDRGRIPHSVVDAYNAANGA